MADATERLLEAGGQGDHNDGNAFATFTKKDAKSTTLTWQDLRYTIALPSGGEKVVLSGATGAVRPGKLACILGPSGAGKSSLLNVLAGRVSTGGAHRVEGTVGVNGHAIDPLSYRENIAYVMQEDAITRTATPREALEFSAALRLDRDVPDGMRRELVSDMLSSLALESVADTMVGSTLIRGISGGEMKRTTIGVELVTQPELLFLDEPTSGLDSNSAFNVIATLRHLARSGCSVLCTIHQPSSEIFHMFDTVLLMNAGELLYSGPCAEVAKTFACPLHHNPADHAMRMLQSDTAQMRKMAAQHKVESVSEETLAPGTPATGVSSSTAHRFKASFWQQTSALAQREWRNTMRDKASLAARFIMTLFLGLFSACIFYQAGDFNRPDYSLNSHFGAVVNLCIGGMFGSAQPMILLFPYERPIFLREYATGTYGAIPYFMSKIIVEITLAFLTQCEMMLISYWLVGFHGNWMLWTLVLWLLALVASSTALLLGCLLTQVKQAMEAAPGIFVPQIIFSGFFIRIQQIPIWLRWAQYCCFLKFALNLCMIVEFSDCPTTHVEECQVLLSTNDVHKDQWWLYLLVLLGMLVVYRGLALTSLKTKAKNFYGS